MSYRPLSPSAPPAPPDAISRRLPLTGTFNTRDIAGYPAVGGRQVADRVILRSDALGGLTDADRDTLRAWGLRTVVDLRDDRERTTAPDALQGLKVRERWVPIFENTLFEHDFGAFPSLEAQYQIMLAEHGEQIGAAIREMLEPGSLPMLMHCTAGKDRTGIVIALTLSAIGVEHDWVLRDFAATQTHLGGAFEASVRELYDRAGLPQHILGTAPAAAPRSFLEGAFDFLTRSHGSVTAFLEAIGIDAAARAGLRSLLLVPQ